MSSGLSTVKSNPSTRTFDSRPVPVGRLGNGSQPLNQPERSMAASADLMRRQPPTGELGAGNPPAQFGGRGDLIRRPYPYLGQSETGLAVNCLGLLLFRTGAKRNVQDAGCEIRLPLQLQFARSRERVFLSFDGPKNFFARAKTFPG